jgi:hypothetical protein
VSVTLALLPVTAALGFLGLAIVGSLAALIAFEATFRAVQRGIMRPARETLFTTVSRADRYKAKAFIDTFVYRAGDVVGAQTEGLLGRLGMGLGRARVLRGAAGDGVDGARPVARLRAARACGVRAAWRAGAGDTVTLERRPHETRPPWFSCRCQRPCPDRRVGQRAAPRARSRRSASGWSAPAASAARSAACG